MAVLRVGRGPGTAQVRPRPRVRRLTGRLVELRCHRAAFDAVAVIRTGLNTDADSVVGASSDAGQWPDFFALSLELTLKSG
ncbi:hypothetical protein [Streptomyces turgidiscabies]|uniref:Uncharacterized protein n=1 Tax=Streptomyces turgidiscabies TaxID=85558 RepID=A0ABU0RXE7_9ACTN|nr:hypothetical protein [Streptomyces turgidiscabies]MDQ0936664.1 hypothetical protein [Streptomyces turgidiscabies]